MARHQRLGNGVKVHVSGNLPDARNPKADKIHGAGAASAKVARVHRTVGGVVHATSHHYGEKGAKGRQLRGAGLGFEEDE